MSPIDPIVDRKTTPVRARLPLLILWYALLLFFLACAHFTLQEKPLPPGWTYFGAFHMFSTKSTNNYEVPRSCWYSWC